MEFTDRVLYEKALPCDFRNPERNQRVADALLWVMHRSQGVGLAAPQLGIMRRLFVMDIDGIITICFNPEIVQKSVDNSQMAEGCLSFPGDSCIIKRPRDISVRYHDAQGTSIETDFTALSARCFQHELDHLDGITMWDRVKEQNAE